MGNKQLFLSISLLLLAISIVSGASYPPPNVIVTNSVNQYEKACYNEGCFEEGKCYPYGYVNRGKFCADNAFKFNAQGAKYPVSDQFVNLFVIGAPCSQNYECSTNLCKNYVCVDQNQEMVELKQEIESLKEQVKEINAKQKEEIKSTIITGEVISNPPEQDSKGIIGKILNWFKGIFE